MQEDLYRGGAIRALCRITDVSAVEHRSRGQSAMERSSDKEVVTVCTLCVPHMEGHGKLCLVMTLVYSSLSVCSVYACVCLHGFFLDFKGHNCNYGLLVLCSFLPSFPSLQSTMIQSIERYMKQAIVDRNPSVASAALVSSVVSFLLWCVAATHTCDSQRRVSITSSHSMVSSVCIHI